MSCDVNSSRKTVVCIWIRVSAVGSWIRVGVVVGALGTTGCIGIRVSAIGVRVRFGIVFAARGIVIVIVIVTPLTNV